MGLFKKRWLIAMIVFVGGPGHATVAINGVARITLLAVASIGEERTLGYQIETDEEETPLVFDPTSLAASASAKVSTGNRSASIAVDARADFLSADHGTFDFNSLTSVSQPASATPGDASRTSQADTPFFYAFTTSADAILTLTGTGGIFSDDPTVTQSHFIFYVQDPLKGITDDLVYESGQTLTRTYDLKANTHYFFDLTPTAGDGHLNGGAFDRLVLKTNHFTFDIVAAPPAPPGMALPEPKTWTMLMLGLAMIGGLLRRARRADVLTAGLLAHSISTLYRNFKFA